MPNFFRIFKETNTSPHARCLRTSYGQKIIDAFFAFAGSINLFTLFVHSFEKPANPQPANPQSANLQPTDPNHHLPDKIGILDLLTFFIPMLLDILTAGAWISENLFVKIVFGSILGVITIPLNLIRIVIAGILAFNPLSLFIIFVIHAISQHVAGGAQLNENVAKLEEAVVFHNKTTNTNSPVTVSNAQDFTLKGASETFDPTQLPRLVLRSGTNKVIGLTLSAVGEKPLPEESGYFYLPLFTSNQYTTPTKSAYSVLKLNTWRVTERMERYVEANRDKPNAQLQEKVAHCQQVLALIK